jgi:hypothetical protein
MRRLLNYQAEAMLSQMGEQEGSAPFLSQSLPGRTISTVRCSAASKSSRRAPSHAGHNADMPAGPTPYLESGEPCTLSVQDSLRVAYIAMRYIISGADPDAHVPPSMDFTAARRLMLAPHHPAANRHGPARPGRPARSHRPHARDELLSASCYRLASSASPTPSLLRLQSHPSMAVAPTPRTLGPFQKRTAHETFSSMGRTRGPRPRYTQERHHLCGDIVFGPPYLIR